MNAAIVLAMIAALAAPARAPEAAGEFAAAIARAVSAGPLPAGETRAAVAAWMAVTGWEECRFRRHCARGDKGRAVCAFQVHARGARALRLERSIQACVDSALAAMVESARYCPQWPLAIYAGGCYKHKAQSIAARRVELALFL